VLSCDLVQLRSTELKELVYGFDIHVLRKLALQRCVPSSTALLAANARVLAEPVDVTVEQRL
jgi:hypothetical protein